MANATKPHPRPLIAITPDIAEPAPGKTRIQCSLNYSRAIIMAGGLPVFISPDQALIAQQLETFDGFVLTGGDDPRTESFGEPTHPAATPMHAQRQGYEVELIQSLLARPEIPVLGICLGMQLLALVAGGKLDQHLPDHHPNSDRHRGDALHPIIPSPGSSLPAGQVVSHHRQAVRDAGRFSVAARSDDGLIEAIQLPQAAFCLGVQWHPERTPDLSLGAEVFRNFMAAAAHRSSRRTG